MSWDLIEDIGIVVGVIVGSAAFGKPLEKKFSDMRSKAETELLKKQLGMEEAHPDLVSTPSVCGAKATKT
jgi:uncharacterized membrane-anchored protein YhcB (DUF1043 family)